MVGPLVPDMLGARITSDMPPWKRHNLFPPLLAAFIFINVAASGLLYVRFTRMARSENQRTEFQEGKMER